MTEDTRQATQLAELRAIIEDWALVLRAIAESNNVPTRDAQVLAREMLARQPEAKAVAAIESMVRFSEGGPGDRPCVYCGHPQFKHCQGEECTVEGCECTCGPMIGEPAASASLAPLHTDEQLLDAFVAGCNAENELNDAELSPQNVRKGVAAAMRAALSGVTQEKPQ